MKARTERPFRALTAALLFLALCAWAGAALYRCLRPARRSAVAARAVYTERAALEGIALREERLLIAREALRPAVADGCRVAAGDAVAFAGDKPLLTSAPGRFCADWDGYETLSPALCPTLDASGLRALLASEPADTENAFGRLVYGFSWYFAALCEEAALLSPGAYRVEFEGREERLPARLVRAENGLVILRLADAEGFSSLRRCSAALILHEEEAIAVPLSALRTLPDGGYAVEVLSASGAQSRPVTVLGIEGASVLLRPAEGEQLFRPGCTVLLG